MLRRRVWAKIMNALAGAHDAAVQMIDTSIVRVHQHAACMTRNRRQSMGRSRGGLTSKIHAVVDTNGLPVRLALTAGEAHDNRLAEKLLSRLRSGAMLLADRGYDADWIRTLAALAANCGSLMLATSELSSSSLGPRSKYGPIRSCLALPPASGEGSAATAISAQSTSSPTSRFAWRLGGPHRVGKVTRYPSACSCSMIIRSRSSSDSCRTS